MTVREKNERREYEFLSSYAAHSDKSKGRATKEPECDIRTVYQRDRDRIIHSKAFRRLKDKTQVFLAPYGDHYRTRLTHTLEVSQTGRTVAKALGLNEDLVEAIALGHDLGHTPFGHAGEDSLNKVCPYGFEHNRQSVRVVELLEKGGDGLNLTYEVKDGILNHRTSNLPSTLEGQIVRICDKISYVHHDMDDSVRAGILKEADLPRHLTELLGGTVRERMNTMIHDLVENSAGKNTISMSAEVDTAMKELREFMFDRVYHDSDAKEEEGRAKDMIAHLYYYYIDHPESMSEEYIQLIDQRGEAIEKVVCDYISGMTDQYSIKCFEEFFVPKSWAKY